MAFTGSQVASLFRKERNQAIHDVTTDTIKMALYTNAATLNSATTVYTTTGEIVNANYTAGGKTLTGVSLTIPTPGGDPVLTWANPSWSPGAFTARGALIYNSSKSNKALYILDFGQDRLADPFVVRLPPAGVEIMIYTSA